MKDDLDEIYKKKEDATEKIKKQAKENREIAVQLLVHLATRVWPHNSQKEFLKREEKSNIQLCTYLFLSRKM